MIGSGQGRSRVDLIIFDCDGVLIDSEIIACGVCAEYVTGLGFSITTGAFAGRYAGMPTRDMWPVLERDIGRSIDPAAREQINAEVHRRFASELREVSGVKALLARIDARRCVASSTSLPNLRKNLETVGLLDAFEPGVFSASQVARGKPAPDVFLYAASQMGADPSGCVVIEDSVPGVTAARRAGMRAIGFVGASHHEAEHAARLTAAGAEQVAIHAEELGTLIIGAVAGADESVRDEAGALRG